MNPKRIAQGLSIALAVGSAGYATASLMPGSLRINSGSGETAASTTWTDWDPIHEEWYTWTEHQSMAWFPGNSGAASIAGFASASLTASFSWGNMIGDWVELGNPAIISGWANSPYSGSTSAHSWAVVSFTNTTNFLFSARVTGGGSVSLHGGASLDIVNGQSIDVWLSAGDYSISLSAGDDGSFFATIPAPGVLTLVAAGAILVPRRRRAIG